MIYFHNNSVFYGFSSYLAVMSRRRKKPSYLEDYVIG